VCEKRFSNIAAEIGTRKLIRHENKENVIKCKEKWERKVIEDENEGGINSDDQ
jgi:hypothetical protein